MKSTIYKKLLRQFVIPAEAFSQYTQENSVMIRRVVLALALTIFIGGLFLCLRQVPDLVDRISLQPFALLFFLCLVLQPLVSAGEFKYLVQIAGKKSTWRQSIEISIVATASNLLPIPGGAVSRIAAMRNFKIATSDAVRLNAASAMIWGGFVFIAGALWALEFRGIAPMLASATAAICLFSTAFITIGSFRSQWTAILKLVGNRILGMTLEAARVALAFTAIGAPISLDQASLFLISTFIGAVVTLAPAGLGVRELITATLSPLVGVDPALGFLSSVVNRVAAILALVIISIPIALTLKAPSYGYSK
ncbi:MAG: hypothetical protein AAGJ73_03325 [Pseudomonadota bacterium]